MKKLFIVSRLVEAESVQQALEIEREFPIVNVYINDDFQKANLPELARDRAIGFREQDT